MRKIIERLALFFVGLPLLIASVFFLPYKNYLVLHIEILFFTVLGILEMHSILKQKLTTHPLFLAIPIGITIPLASFLYAVCGLPQRIITYSIAIAFISILFLEFILSFTGKFEKSIERIASSAVLVMYPGYLVMYLSIITVWENAGIVLSLFFVMVFGCDSIAWLLGVLFGKKNRGFLPASPNKSIMGFIGGYVGSLIPAGLFYYLFPEVFHGSLYKIVLLAVLNSTAAIIGDIIESILKRSAGVKDSGHFIPGRGGVLDSIDSILLAAPVFYIMSDFLYGFMS